MTHALDVFRAFTRIELSLKSQYRANVALGLVGLLVEPIVYLVVWSNVAKAQGGSVGGFSSADIAAYYLVLLLVRNMTSAPGPHLQARRIRTGEMSFVLLRPVHPFWGDFAEASTFRISSLSALLPIALVIGVAFGARIPIPPWWSLAALIPSLLLAGFIRFMLHYTISMLGFWFDRIDGLWSTYWTLQTFLSGMLAPLTLLPQPLQVVASILPFKWVFSFPIDLVLNPLTAQDVLIGLAIQTAWCLGLIVAMFFLWRAGLRRYSAVGG